MKKLKLTIMLALVLTSPAFLFQNCSESPKNQSEPSHMQSINQMKQPFMAKQTQSQQTPPVNLPFGSPCPVGSVCSYTGAGENQGVTMSCSAGGYLTVDSATFSSTGGKGGSESCADYVAPICDNVGNCSFKFSDKNCGADPDPGFVKSGSAVISCTAGYAYTPLAFGSACPFGSVCKYTGASENQTVSVSCGVSNTNIPGSIFLETASYYSVGGSGGRESCLNYATPICNNQSGCSMTFKNTTCGGDPNPRHAKSAYVVVSCAVNDIGSIPTSFAPQNRPITAYGYGVVNQVLATSGDSTGQALCQNLGGQW